MFAVRSIGSDQNLLNFAFASLSPSQTSSECAVTSSSIPYNPPFSPPPPPPPPPISVSSTLSLSPSPPHPASSPPAANGLRSEPGTSGLGREEIINVDSSDDVRFEKKGCRGECRTRWNVSALKIC